VMAIQAPVSTSATVGQIVGLTLDPNNALWYDPNSHLYPVELKSGTMTVGGTLSVSDVNPGSGIVQPGAVISITGTGFDASTTVDINEASVATTKFVSSTLMQVTLSAPFEIRGKRVRVTNSSKELATYYPYQHTQTLGTSNHALVASSIPLFAQTTWSVGYFRPTVNGTIFTGLALQNLNQVKANVVLSLSKNGVVLGTRKVLLDINSSGARDLAELFPGNIAGTGTSLKVSSDQPIQMMGLLGDDSTATLLPVNPRSTP
jgi:IPT/TIG domain-containing protein